MLGVPGGLRHPAGAGADTRPARAGHVVHRRVRAAPPRARSVFRAADVAGRVRGRALRAHVVVPARAPGLGGSVLAASLVPGRAIRDGRGRRHLGATGARARASVTPPPLRAHAIPACCLHAVLPQRQGDAQPEGV